MPSTSTPREEVVPILRVVDAEASALWYARLGFRIDHVHRFEPHLPAFVTLVRNEITVFLSEHIGDARPGSLVYLRVHDLDSIATEFGVDIEDSPWGRELDLTDPDNNRLRVGTPSWW